MKKILGVLLGLMLLCSPAWAALDAAMVWECRTTGSDNNGGAFKAGATGTDFSQQNAAEDSGTDLACADGDAAAPVVTSATHDFLAADVGNIINITEAGDGFTLGRYEIKSVNANAATLDRACGADGALTGGDWYLGGAIGDGDESGIQIACDAAVAGNTIYIKNGTWTLAAQVDIDVTAGTNALPIKVVGYGSTRGDNVLCVIDGNDAVDYIFYSNSKGYWFFYNLELKQAVLDGVGMANNTYHLSYINCKSHDHGRYGFTVDYYGVAINCETYNNASNGIYAIRYVSIYGCYSHDNTANGIDSSGGTNIIERCIIESNGQDGIGFGFQSGTVLNCVIDANTRYGINFADHAGLIANNIITNHSGAGDQGINCPTGVGQKIINNAFFGNTSDSDATNMVGSITLTGSPFTTAGSDWTLNNTAGAGAACKEAGIPETVGVYGTQNNYPDVGAYNPEAVSTSTTAIGVIGG